MRKYELIHLTRNPKKFNMNAAVNIENIVIELKVNIRILGLQLDTGLKWNAHIDKIQSKMTTQRLALSRLTTSTWGASLTKTRTIYSAVIRPVISYAATVWRAPQDAVVHVKGIDKKLNVIQNGWFRIITGAFKATPVEVSKAEGYTEPLPNFLNKLQAKSRLRAILNDNTEQVIASCRERKIKFFTWTES